MCRLDISIGRLQPVRLVKMARNAVAVNTTLVNAGWIERTCVELLSSRRAPVENIDEREVACWFSW